MSAEPEDPPLGFKQCPRCSEPKPLSEFGKVSRYPDEKDTYCKKHRNELTQESRERRKPPPKPGPPPLPPGMKRCAYDGDIKPIAEFTRDAGRPDCLDPYCREHQKELRLKRKAEHGEEDAAYLQQWVADHPERVKLHKQKSRELHRDEENAKARQRRAADPEKNNAYHRNYAKDHPENGQKQKRARRARELGNGFEAYEKKADIFEPDGYRCQSECGEILASGLVGTTDPKAPEVGHIVQMGDGGPDYLWNVRTECLKCNRKHLTEHGKDQGRLSQLRLPLRMTEGEPPPPPEIYYRIGRLITVAE